jgi:hypothetical protein
MPAAWKLHAPRSNVIQCDRPIPPGALRFFDLTSNPEETDLLNCHRRSLPESAAAQRELEGIKCHLNSAVQQWRDCSIQDETRNCDVPP